MDSLIPTQDIQADGVSGASSPGQYARGLGQHDFRPEGAASPLHAGQDVASDILPFIKRYSLLFLACTVIGGALGVLNYMHTDPTYESTSAVLVENQRSASFSNEFAFGYTPNEKTIDTHVLIIHSPLVVKGAMNKLDLAKCPSLRVINQDARVARIRRNLDVEKEGDWSNVMTLTYTSGSEVECEEVLTKVVGEYQAFLSKSSKDVGQETSELITNARDVLQRELAQKRTTYDVFRKDAPLIWKDGKGVNPHLERQMEVEKKRSELLVENSTLSAKLKNTIDALRSGGERRKAVYFEALREIHPDAKSNANAGIELPQRQFVAALTDEYVKLRADEQALATRFGEGHPDLLDIRNRMASLRETLGFKEQSEPVYDENGIATQADEIDYVAIYVNMLNDRLATVEEQVADLDRVYEGEKGKANSLQSYQIQDEDFRKDLEATERLFDAVVSRLEEINIVRDNGGDTIDVLAPAELGLRVAPLLLTNLVPGCLLGLFCGCGLSYVFDRSAAMFRSPSEIRNALRVPVIGRIPVIERKETKVLEEFSSISPILCSVHRHGSSLAEAYRAVRTSLFFSMAGSSHRVIQVTSPLPGDGKSTLAANLAVTIAKSGKTVLLVDADFRRPTLHKLFGIESLRTGLVSVVQRQVAASEAIIASGIKNLDVLPVNQRAHNPAELLTSPEFKLFLEEMRVEYDFVLVDTPPLLAVTDPSAVAAQVDGVILVLRIRRGVQVAAVRAREMLSDVNANVLGVVVNAVEKKSGYGRYEYGYGYGGYGYGYTNDTNGSENQNSPPSPQGRRKLAVHTVK